jgi:biopolymer transport protein ExbD
MRKSRTSPKLFSDFNTVQFASVMGMVIFVPLVILMTMATPHHTVSADWPKVMHSVAMPGALREDVMQVTVLRDGKVYFGSDRVDTDDLAGKIQQRLRDRGVERKVYNVADTRAHWGAVKLVLDSVRSAGILRVAFLTNQRSS